MGRSVSEHPTEFEMLILKILWERAPLPVRDVRAALAEQGRELAHTTVITTLNRMVDKQYLNRVRRGKEFLFSPQVEQQEVRRRMLGDLVRRLFDGSPAAVVLSLFDAWEVDDQELDELRRIVRREAKRTQGGSL